MLEVEINNDRLQVSSNMNINNFDQPVGDAVDLGQEREQLSTAPMQGQFCRIEKLLPDKHGRALYLALCQFDDHKNWTYLPYGPFDSFASFEQWLVESAASSDPLFYVIIDIKTDQAIGLASYLRINPENGVVEIGHLHFSTKMQQTAHASEAMYLMMKRVFEEQRYRRYEWKCDDLNGPSKRAALRLGFSFEGVFRQATIYKNRNRDTAWFAILDTQWPQLKQAFESWLEVDNFTEAAQQKATLQSFRS